MKITLAICRSHNQFMRFKSAMAEEYQGRKLIPVTRAADLEGIHYAQIVFVGWPVDASERQAIRDRLAMIAVEQ